MSQSKPMYREAARAIVEDRRKLGRKELRRRRAEARQRILESAKNGGFYPAYDLTDLGLPNRTMRRLADGMTRKGVLEKHRNGEYQSEGGREIGTVYYTLKDGGESNGSNL